MAGKMASRKKKEKAFNVLALFHCTDSGCIGTSSHLVDFPFFPDEHGSIE